MKIAIIDISNKVPFYDSALCHAIADNIDRGDTFKYLAPYNSYTDGNNWYKRLFSFVPKSMSKNYSKARKILKCLETGANYLYILFYLKFNSIDVAHFQWFPFLDYSILEVFILKLLRLICPKMKIVFTDHNIIPHDLSEAAAAKYKERFSKITPYIDRYIVHTESSKDELSQIFGVDKEIIDVVYHGIFTSEYKPSTKEIDYSNIRFTMFGSQSYYKGTDIFIDAIDSLTAEQKEHISVTIIGPTSENLYREYGDKATKNNIEWINNWVTMDQLQNTIDRSDVIVLPYRSISQSGVLLQALYFKKIIIASDLPSFKETLKGFTDDMFFKSGDKESLKALITNHMNKNVDLKVQRESIEHLNELYSWRLSASNTLKCYYKV